MSSDSSGASLVFLAGSDEGEVRQALSATISASVVGTVLYVLVRSAALALATALILAAGYAWSRLDTVHSVVVDASGVVEFRSGLRRRRIEARDVERIGVVREEGFPDVVALRFDLGGEVFELPEPRDVSGLIATIEHWNRRLQIVCVAE